MNKKHRVRKTLRIIILVFLLVIAITTVSRYTNWIQWLLELLSKIFPFGSGKTSFLESNMPATLPPKALSTVIETLPSTPTITMPIPTVRITLEPSPTATMTIRPAPTATLSPTPTPTMVPIPTLAPPPEITSSICSFYFSERDIEKIVEGESFSGNIVHYSVTNCCLILSSSNDIDLINIYIDKIYVETLIINDILGLKIPYANVHLSDVIRQLEETNTDKLQLKWELIQGEYRLYLIYKKNGFDIYELVFGERKSIIY